jgi:phosphopantetheinyl transferase
VNNHSTAVETRVFNAGEAGFQIGAAAESLRRNELVVLFSCSGEQIPVHRTELLGLGAAEVRRFQSFKSQSAASMFLQGRALLRNLLVGYSGVPAGQIHVTCEENVKPAARCTVPIVSMPQFNLSHSGTWIVLAAHIDRPLGVDIECAEKQDIANLSDLQDLFTPTERAHLKLCPNHNARVDLFLSLWRCKEAILKATGRGFDLAPTSFEVLTHEGTMKTVVQAEGHSWHLQQLTLCQDLDCAVAVRSS